jgi:hypothetical protein
MKKIRKYHNRPATCGNIAEIGDGDTSMCRPVERKIGAIEKHIANVTELVCSQKVLLKKLKMLKVILLQGQSFCSQSLKCSKLFCSKMGHCSKNYVLN